MSVHFPAGPWLRVILYFRNGDTQWQNDLWFKVTAAVPPDTDINAVAAAVDTALASSFVACMGADAAYIGNTCYLNNGTYTTSAETVQSMGGGADGAAIPSEDAAIVRLDAGLATRSGNGRIFVGGLANSLIQESRLSPTGITLVTAIKTALTSLTEAAGVAIKVAVWSRKLAALEPVLFAGLAAVLGHRTKRRPIH